MRVVVPTWDYTLGGFDGWLLVRTYVEMEVWL